MVHRRWHWSATPLRCCGRMLIWPGVMRTTSSLHLRRKREGMVRKRLVWVGAIALLVVAGAAAVGGPGARVRRR